MSADCLYVLRNCSYTNQLKTELSDELQKHDLGVWFTPSNALLLCTQIYITPNTFLFEPTDAPNSISSELLLSPDYYPVNDVLPTLPFEKRAALFQRLAQIGLRYADSLEIYVSEDNPYLPDYLIYDIAQDQIYDTFMLEYQKDERRVDPIPCICMRVSR